MAIYAIGDVHGCFATLKRLLRRIAFDRPQDTLWMVGDLVNRGPRSLEVLRWAVDLDGRDGRIVAVLGNHDLHLLARARGLARERRRDTLEAVLEARDRDDLLTWLQSRPLLHREDSHVVVHAGLLPEWTLDAAEELAREVEEELRGRQPERLLKTLKAESPGPLRRRLSPLARRRRALSAFTRLRTLTAGGLPCLDFSGPPGEAPAGCVPWFAAPGRKNRGARILCGHWAALGLLLEDGVAALDTGCVWGQSLTALRLDDGTVFQEPAGEE